MRREPFRPAGCSGRLEEGIRVGLKTMLKSEKSPENIRAFQWCTTKREKPKDNVLYERLARLVSARETRTM